MSIRITALAVLSSIVCCTPGLLALPSLPVPDRLPEVDRSTRARLLRRVFDDPTIVYKRFREVCLRDFQHPKRLKLVISETPTARLVGGYIEALSLEAEGGGVDYVKLDSFRIDCKGVRFDFEKLMVHGILDVRRIEKMDLSLTVNEEAFNEMFRKHSRRLRVANPKVRMLDGELEFSGSVRAFIFKSRVVARGPIQLTPEGRVNFNLRRLKVSGISLPGPIVRQIARSVNPITDFRNFKFWDCWNMQLRSVILRKGSMTLSSFPVDQDSDGGGSSMVASAGKSGAAPCLSRPGVLVFE